MRRGKICMQEVMKENNKNARIKENMKDWNIKILNQRIEGLKD